MISGASHWLCTLISVKELKVSIFDSRVSGSLNEATVLQLANLLHTNEQYFTIQRVPVQQQTGSVECGVFAIAFGIAVCMGRNPKDCVFEQVKMREHLVLSLENKYFMPFPENDNCVDVLPLLTK